MSLVLSNDHVRTHVIINWEEIKSQLDLNLEYMWLICAVMTFLYCTGLNQSGLTKLNEIQWLIVIDIPTESYSCSVEMEGETIAFSEKWRAWGQWPIWRDNYARNQK